MAKNTTPIYERGVNQAFREHMRQRLEAELLRAWLYGEGAGNPTGIVVR